MSAEKIPDFQGFDGRPKAPSSPAAPRLAKPEGWAPEPTADAYLALWREYVGGAQSLPDPIALLRSMSGLRKAREFSTSRCVVVARYVEACPGFGWAKPLLLRAAGFQAREWGPKRGTGSVAEFKALLQTKIDRQPLKAGDFLHIELDPPRMSTGEMEQLLIIQAIRTCVSHERWAKVRELQSKLLRVQQSSASSCGFKRKKWRKRAKRTGSVDTKVKRGA